MRRHPEYPFPKCDAPMAEWTVTCWRGNHSAFNGYRFQSSSYSQIKCDRCGWVWRSKAKYADTLKSGSLI